MTLYVTQLEAKPEHRSFRLSRPAGAVTSEVRDDLVTEAGRAREVLAAAAAKDVGSGGPYSAGPAGVQLWSGAWNGVPGGPGTAEHLGSVDWSWDSPVTNYVTIYRVMLTAAGVARGLSHESILGAVLGLAGVQVETRARNVAAIPPPRDPFRSSEWAPRSLTG